MKQRAQVAWSQGERKLLDSFRKPADIQAFLDVTPYSTDPIYRAPRAVMRDRRAHCFDGGMLAAAALRHHGERPLLVNLRAVRDDDHVIAIYRQFGRFGAIAKSNVAGLRFREPIFRNLRELVLSYFESYYNLEKEKTLRAYSVAVDLTRFDRLSWWFRDEAMEDIASALDRARHVAIAPAPVVLAYSPVDQRMFDSGLMGADWAGLHKNS